MPPYKKRPPASESSSSNPFKKDSEEEEEDKGGLFSFFKSKETEEEEEEKISSRTIPKREPKRTSFGAKPEEEEEEEESSGFFSGLFGRKDDDEDDQEEEEAKPRRSFRSRSRDSDDEEDEGEVELEEETKDRWITWQPKIASKEGIVIASVILFASILLIYNIANSIDDTILDGGWHFQLFSFLIFLSTFILFLMASILVYRDRMTLVRTEVKGSAVFAVGAFMLLLIPIALMGDGTSDAVLRVIMMVIGIPIVLAGMVLLARDGGFFLPWFIGVFAFTITVFTEAAKFHSFNGTFGPTDIVLHILTFIFIGASFLLFFYGQIKFLFLFDLVEKAIEKKNDEDLEGSLGILDIALLIYPDFITALNNKGNVLYAMEDYEEAKECYNQALELNPNYPWAKRNLDVLEKKGGKKRKGFGKRSGFGTGV